TGALGLHAFCERFRQFKPDDDLAHRQAFLNELAELAVKNCSGRQHAGEISSSSDFPAENVGTLDAASIKLKTALDKT
ncbi:FtsK/SpoIIIE domain-containing protein, partial [Neisseria sp. P0015.S009]